MFIVIVFLAITAGGITLLINRMTSPGASETEPRQKIDATVAGFDLVSGVGDHVLIHLKPTFTVNLSGVGGRYVMRVQIRLEISDRSTVDFLNENPAEYHRMIDMILGVLKSKTYVELALGDGIERLKEELRARINAYLPGKPVLRVLFHELYFAEILPFAHT